MIYITGDLHGGETAYHVSSKNFSSAKQGDIVLCCGDFGGVWYHDYHTNERHRREENYFLESRLRQKLLWLAVDGNHENFARLFGGEFPLVELFGGKAYQIRRNVYHLKRGEIFTIDGKTFLAFGGAMSHDKEAEKTIRNGIYHVTSGRKEGINWWPEEIPSPEDLANAYRNLKKVGWYVDYVITHTCPTSQRALFMTELRPPDPTEAMLQEIYNRIYFKAWHFGHFHVEKQVDNFVCHYTKVRPLEPFAYPGSA